MSAEEIISPERVRRILCVCTGNSCRSVMAQGLLRQFLKGCHPEIRVLSAGLGTVGGMGPTPETIEVMEAEGVDVSSHLSQPLTPDLVDKADLILVMDRFHLESIVRRQPEAKGKIFLLKEFQANELVDDPNIPDPIGQPLEVYEGCLAAIKEAVQRVVAWLTRRP